MAGWSFPDLNFSQLSARALEVAEAARGKAEELSSALSALDGPQREEDDQGKSGHDGEIAATSQGMSGDGDWGLPEDMESCV